MYKSLATAVAVAAFSPVVLLGTGIASASESASGAMVTSVAQQGVSTVAPKPAAKPKVTVYVVRRGDCLWTIGQRLHMRWQTIAELNHIKAPYLIFPNEKLRV
jgi:nucleoid-associated protein YgaU